jgi:hypothetical protein
VLGHNIESAMIDYGVMTSNVESKDELMIRLKEMVAALVSQSKSIE